MVSYNYVAKAVDFIPNINGFLKSSGVSPPVSF